MFKITNKLNQPLMIGELSLAAGGSLKVEKRDDEIGRLEKSGHVSVVKDKAETPTPATLPKKDAETKEGEKK